MIPADDLGPEEKLCAYAGVKALLGQGLQDWVYESEAHNLLTNIRSAQDDDLRAVLGDGSEFGDLMRQASATLRKDPSSYDVSLATLLELVGAFVNSPTVGPLGLLPLHAKKVAEEVLRRES